jgi:hypothetical protein
VDWLEDDLSPYRADLPRPDRHRAVRRHGRHRARLVRCVWPGEQRHNPHHRHHPPNAGVSMSVPHVAPPGKTRRNPTPTLRLVHLPRRDGHVLRSGDTGGSGWGINPDDGGMRTSGARSRVPGPVGGASGCERRPAEARAAGASAGTAWIVWTAAVGMWLPTAVRSSCLVMRDRPATLRTRASS